MNNKVTVNIYGKEFTVSGDKPPELPPGACTEFMFKLTE